MDFIVEHIPIYVDLHKNVIKKLINDQDLIDWLQNMDMLILYDTISRLFMSIVEALIL